MMNVAKRTLCLFLTAIMAMSLVVLPGSAATVFVPRNSMTDKIPDAEVTKGSDAEAWDRIERAYDEMVKDHPQGLVWLYQSVVEAYYRNPENDKMDLFTDDPTDTSRTYLGVQLNTEGLTDVPLRAVVKEWANQDQWMNPETAVLLIPDDVKSVIRNDIMVPFLNNLADFLRYRYENKILNEEGKPYQGMTAKAYYESVSDKAGRSSDEGKQALMDYIAQWIIEGTFYISLGFDPMSDPQYAEHRMYTVDDVYFGDVVDNYDGDVPPSNYNPEEYQALIDYGVDVVGHREIRLILKTWVNNFRQYIILAGQFGTVKEWIPVVEALNYDMGIAFRAEGYDQYGTYADPNMDPVDFEKIKWFKKTFGAPENVPANDDKGETLVGKIFYDEKETTKDPYATKYTFDALRIWGTKKSSGGPGGPSGPDTYKINVIPEPNGTTTADKSESTPGKKITFTPNPSDGYKVDTIEVKTKGGDPVPVTDNGDGTYSFVMPKDNVNIDVTFVGDQPGIYNVIVYTPKHGTTTADKKQADEGDNVHVVTKPDTGYTLGYISVVDKDGRSVIPKDNGDGTYDFTMPPSDVYIDTKYVTEGTKLYTVDVIKEENGIAIPDKTKLPAGEQVLVYTKGNPGCDLISIEAVTDGGVPVTLNKSNDNLYYFTMPEDNVHISVVYKPSSDYHEIIVVNVENGTTTVSKDIAKGGDKVIITPKPESGYQVTSMIVVDDNGNRIQVHYQPDGTYYFIMPKDSDVHITPTYRKKTKVGHYLETEEHGNYIIGYPEGDVRPNINITREEVATIFYRLLRDDMKQQYTTDDVSMFTDVEQNRWSVYQIATMAAIGVVQGYPDGSFKPGAPITRAEFATVVSRFEMYDGVLTDMFPDDNGHWAEMNINSVAMNGWVMGYEDGTFRPDQNILRCEAVTIINRALQRNVDREGISKIRELKLWWDISTDHWAYYEFIEACFSHDYVRRYNNQIVENWKDLNPKYDRLEYDIYAIMQSRGVNTGVTQDQQYHK